MLQRDYRPSLPSAMSPLADRTSLPLPPVARFADHRRGGCGRAAPSTLVASACARCPASVADVWPPGQNLCGKRPIRRSPRARVGAEPRLSAAYDPRRRRTRSAGLVRAGRSAHRPARRSSASLRASASSSAATQVGRQRRAHVDRHAGDRVVEREPLRVQELALEPVAAPPSRTGGRRTPDDRSPPGGPGSGGCGRCRATPAAAPPAGSRRSISKCVRAARGASVSIDISARSRRSRPIGASIVPVRADGWPSTRAEVLAAHRRARQQRLQRAVDLVVLGDDEQPGRVAVEPVHDPGAPRLLAAGRDARRAPGRASPSGAPAPGWTTTPAGLSTTSRYSSS